MVSDLNIGSARIGVLMGGCSSERDISLKSGHAITQALQESGCQAFPIELRSHEEQEVLSLLNSFAVEVVFVAMHGAFGEDGTLQAILAKHGFVYTGSDAGASRLAMNKIAAQQFLQKNGILVPDHIFVSREQGCSLELMSDRFADAPVVVKPAGEGSSIGISVVRHREDFNEALEKAFQYGQDVLVERYIEGKEITAGILGREALPLVEIRPRMSFFDFQAKYEKGLTDYIVPAEISHENKEIIQQAALKAFRLLNCRDIGRADFILDSHGRTYFLEMNTIPGFTSTSLLPKAAREAGCGFEELCCRIVRFALERRTNQFTGQRNNAAGEGGS